MQDLISRQAAIDALKAHEDYKGYLHGDFEEILGALPSEQPAIIRCKDCKHKHCENMVWTCPFGLSGGENFFCGYGAEPYKGERE